MTDPLHPDGFKGGSPGSIQRQGSGGHEQSLDCEAARNVQSWDESQLGGDQTEKESY